jgi:hypothetical protein
VNSALNKHPPAVGQGKPLPRVQEGIAMLHLPNAAKEALTPVAGVTAAAAKGRARRGFLVQRSENVWIFYHVVTDNRRLLASDAQPPRTRPWPKKN